MRILYGIASNNIDVTEICNEQLKYDNHIIIPAGDVERATVFTDPLPNVLKSIFIVNNGSTVQYHYSSRISIDINTYTVDELVDPIRKLQGLQGNLVLHHGTFTEELPEQKMAIRYLKGTESVLEIGGNIGRNSLIIASILKDPSKLVVLESDANISEQLKDNRDINGLGFHIEAAALSKRPLIQKGWDTMVSDIVLEGYTPVSTITYSELMEKYKIPFDTLVLDCEGAFYYILQDMPEILEGIHLIIMENDYKEGSHKEYIDDVLKKNNFYVDYAEAGGWWWDPCPCRNNFFEVWKRV